MIRKHQVWGRLLVPHRQDIWTSQRKEFREWKQLVQRLWGRSVPGICEEQPGMSMGVVGEEAREMGLYMSHGSLQSLYKLFFNFCYRKFQACAKQNSIMNPLSTYHPGLINIYSGPLFFLLFFFFFKKKIFFSSIYLTVSVLGWSMRAQLPHSMQDLSFLTRN